MADHSAEASGKQGLIASPESPGLEKGFSWVSWWTALCWLIGAVIQLVGIYSSVAPAVYTKEVTGNCMGDLNDWLAFFVGGLGLAFWLVAALLRVTEALNVGHGQRVSSWEAGGRQGPRPRYRWVGFEARRLEFWGALCYLVGVALFFVGLVALIINDCPGHLLPTLTYLWTVFYLTLIAGWIFALGGLLYVMANVSLKVYPGIFVPLSREDARSLHWWGRWLYFWGGVLFIIGGMQLYWFSNITSVESFATFNALTGFAYGGGFILYAAGAALFLALQARHRGTAAGHGAQSGSEVAPATAEGKV